MISQSVQLNIYVPLYKTAECSLYMRMQYSRGISEPEDLQVYDTDKRLLDPRKTRRDEYLEFISHNFHRNRKSPRKSNFLILISLQPDGLNF